VRITSLGPADRLGAAIIPIPAHDGKAYQGRGLIFGSPGVIPVRAPGSGVPQDRTAQATMGLYRSSGAPNFFRPSIYYIFGRQAATPPVSVSSDNQMPVPAVDPRGVPFVASRRNRIAGQFQVANPVVAPRYRNRLGS
jgi:hypothetical protein